MDKKEIVNKICNLIEELRFKGNHAVQYYFGTQKAINLLNKVSL